MPLQLPVFIILLQHSDNLPYQPLVVSSDRSLEGLLEIVQIEDILSKKLKLPESLRRIS